MDAILQGFADQGIELSQAQQAQLIQSLTQESEANGRNQAADTLTILPPTTSSASEPVSLLQTILRSIMGGMMIFYAFYTGVSASQDHPPGTGKGDFGPLVHLPNTHPDHPER